jgi:hypothetical protein
MNKKRPTSDFLFARPAPVFGLARFFDLSGSFDDYNSSESPDEADAKAMYADWSVVGDSLGYVVRKQLDEPDDEKEAA